MMEMICSEKIYQHVIYLLIAIISVTSIMTVFPIPEGWLCQWASASINYESQRIPIDQLKIGGIGCGSSVDYVKSIYGEPSKVSEKKKNYLYDLLGYTITYGDSFHLYVLVEKDGKEDVVNIKTTANNGLAMPCGIKVGSSVREMYQNFGVPYQISMSKNGVIYYTYKTKYTNTVTFLVDNKHIVREISILSMS